MIGLAVHQLVLVACLLPPFSRVLPRDCDDSGKIIGYLKRAAAVEE